MFEIRRTRAVAQGRRKLTREREEYFRLVQQGVRWIDVYVETLEADPARVYLQAF
ncbi:hypothetical protein [Streptomyces sp. NPDC020597]|uniref:hypothetical protein n=1 Tax=unclassified Streptomyces TaxID=2593676 RepID=UPI0037B1FBA0